MKGSSSNSSPRLQRRRLRDGLIAALACLITARAEARIYIQIDQASEKKFPIAIVEPVSSEDGASREWGKKLAETIRSDLKLTGLFDLIPEDQFPNSAAARSTDPSQIQFSPWTLIGAQALVNGSYSKGKEGTKVELHLYDPFLGQHLIGRNYTAKSDDVGVVAHHFADEIMRELTGEAGVFSTQIAFVQAGKKTKEIAVMDMDGGNPHNVTKDKTIDISPAWSADGRIAYTTFSKNENMEVALVGGKRLTTNGAVNLSPAWTPGGQLSIATDLNGNDTDIYLMNGNGDLAKKIAGGYGIDVNQSWSPDGSAFVFASERAGKLHLFKADAGGGNVERLTFVGTQNDNPAWSPKGDKIAFQSLSGGWDIFVMNTDGSMIQRLTSAGNCESPTWAPNGRFIAASCGGKVTIMREDGSNPTPVGPSGAYQPSWGPWAK
jgi:TolB protein